MRVEESPLGPDRGPDGGKSDAPSLFRPVVQVLHAELLRHLRAAPISFWVATLVFPFLTILALYYLPGMSLSGKFHLRPAAYEGLSEVLANTSGPTRDSLARLLEDLEAQPYYKLTEARDARQLWRDHEADLALVFRLSAEKMGGNPGEAADGPKVGGGPISEVGGGPVRIEIYRRPDFLSDLFLDHLEKVRRRHSRSGSEEVPNILQPVLAAEIAEADDARSGLQQSAPFILFGFAWFFLTVGVVEAFVVERERRTLELLLCIPVDRGALATGKISFVVVQAALAEISGTIGLELIGFSPWTWSLTLLILLSMVPFTVLCFRYFRNTDNSLAAGWRNGLVFMMGFPLLILADDVGGTLSPLYRLSKVFEGPPPPLLYLVCLCAVSLLVWLSLRWLPSVVRGWSS